ncbi:hypothetical protein [Vulgatibacter sp.]|uniref:hypothetical protein n=1 Tax=Vulgatibacter sp. TaxID=1971226 RepID=UPI0035654CB9
MERHLWCGILAAALATGCASAQKNERTETILTAAGFEMRQADTPEKEAHLRQLEQRRLVEHMQDHIPFYVYADAEGCNCMYVGDEADYRNYQQLAAQEELAEERREAVQAEQAAAMDWELWGPWW